MQEKGKLIVKDETHEKIYDEVDEDDLYELEKRILGEIEWHKCVFEIKLKNTYDIKNWMVWILYMKTK